MKGIANNFEDLECLWIAWIDEFRWFSLTYLLKLLNTIYKQCNTFYFYFSFSTLTLMKFWREVDTKKERNQTHDFKTKNSCSKFVYISGLFSFVTWTLRDSVGCCFVLNFLPASWEEFYMKTWVRFWQKKFSQ